jgi:hyaluronoglucosaminidase
MRGIIEGFYGPPWSWDDRRAIATALAAAGMDTYVYAPKDDPLHRERWRDPYPDHDLEHFATFAGDGTLQLSIGISPGLTMDPDDHSDRADLLVKCDQLVGAGATVIGLLLDDLPPQPGLGARHGHLTAWLRDALPSEVELFLTPTRYTGTSPSPYLADLDRLVPAEVPIAWTGPTVVCDRITGADAEAWSAAVGGRSPLLWDNVPVNDAVMSDHLFPGPLRGRDPDLPGHLAGYLANPMVQARASVPSLLSAAAWLRGEDPEEAWAAVVGRARVLAEGCDAVRIAALVDDVLGAGGAHGPAADELLAWLRDAERCDDGGWGEEVRPWVDALRAEAAVARGALEVLRSDPLTARRSAPVLLLTWPRVRAHTAQVLGGRGGVRPVMGQDDDLHWVAEPGAFVPPASLCDRLVRAAFDSLA